MQHKLRTLNVAFNVAYFISWAESCRIDKFYYKRFLTSSVRVCKILCSRVCVCCTRVYESLRINICMFVYVCSCIHMYMHTCIWALIVPICVFAWNSRFAEVLCVHVCVIRQHIVPYGCVCVCD